MTPEDQDKLAKTRFAVMNAARAGGVAIMLLGMFIIASGVIQPKETIGTIIFAAGFAETLILPRILARKWRTPPGS
jgi:hypothetical protein